MNPANRQGAASVRARLLNVAKAQGVDFNQVLVVLGITASLVPSRAKRAARSAWPHA